MVVLTALAGCVKNDRQRGNGKKPGKEVELTVSAAISLQGALDEIAANFEKENKNIKINYNYGASGALQQQISQGAPVDLFFSAATDKMDALEKDGLIEKGTRVELVGNEIVLVVPKNSKKNIKTFEDLAKADRISIGTPETVPAGKYAKETLETLGIWQAVKEVVYAKDVRQVLTYVETANVDAGIVYKTDAMGSKKVGIADTAAENTHGPIVYPIGVIKDSRHLKEARVFYDYLISDESVDVLEKHGFKSLK
ncbi:molybdate ABC transporter substrate-binding protein [Neobacillus notoginsengisoli]|uniref:Molybdate ABC transporter substrate-binding protein n=1 Tax=Neobacillus notoginsengisoli TaxID=1578198 RepID=A0A417YMJ8_9BACI|nr:molybdate ABC transporter substrate-binding protein [Neobacillus notoginsengisoli]